MNAHEAAILCRATKAVCPSQKFDEQTPDFWHLLLEDIGFDDAKHALIEVAKRQPFVSPAEIRAQVAQTNRAMKRELPAVIPPRDLADDPRLEIQWTRVWGDAFIAGHTEDRARQIANRQIGITEDEPLAIEGSPAALVKARMSAEMAAIVHKQSLRQADVRAVTDEKRERHRRIRESELATTGATPDNPEETT